MSGKGTRIELVIDGKDKTRPAFGAVSQGLSQLDTQATALGGKLKGVLAAYLSLNTIKSIARIKDEWTDLSGRIKVATGSQSDYERSVKRLEEISERTFSSMTSNAELFIQSLKPLQEQGFSTSKVLDFTEAVNLGLDASGAKGEAAAAVIRQLSQALQVGVLRGQDFNSVLTGAPEIINAVALSLGKSRRELLAMARAGELTTEVFVPALIEQMDSMGEKADQAEKTVTDAMFTLTNNFNKAIAGADVKPLVDGLTELSDVVKDPATQEGLAQLAGGVARLSGIGLRSLSGLGDLGVDIGAFFAQITGGLSATDKLERKIKELDRMIASPWRKASSRYALFSEDDIKAQRALAQSLLDLENERLTGMTSAMREAALEQKKIADEQQEIEMAARRKNVADLEASSVTILKIAKDKNKELLSEEKKYLSDIEKLKKKSLEIEETYAIAIQKFNSGSGKAEGPTYGAANALKVKAKEANRRGDTKTAQKLAREALGMLEAIGDAGGNTYGFAGFAKDLEAIEKQAVELDKTDIESKLRTTLDLMKYIEHTSAELEDMPISVELDEESLIEAKEKLLQFTEKLKKDVKLGVDTGAATEAKASNKIRKNGENSFTNVTQPTSSKSSQEYKDGPNSFTNIPKQQKNKVRGVYQDGPNSFTDIPKVVVEIEPKPVDPAEFTEAAKVPALDAEILLDNESVSKLDADIARVVEQLKQVAVVPVRLELKEGSAKSTPAASASNVPGFATGGRIRGPGTGTSDSILARVSNGEYVMSAAAVKKYGANMMDNLNGMSIPQFNTGGMVNTVSNAEPRSIGTVSFHLPGGDSFSLDVAGANSMDDLHRAALKFGRTRR